MTKLGLLGTSALRSAALIALFATPFSAAAQQVDAEQDSSATLQSEAEIESGTSADAGNEAIVVTGSRIRRPNLESTIPITSVGGDEFFETGNISVGDVLNELPSLRNTFSMQNAGQSLGTVGLTLLDLRGLGTARTLVLVNGRRHVGSDILVNAVSPDVNTIPSDLIERVDVVTGGNSAIYGSDAIAGVVNFILKRDFDGQQIRAQGGISDYGDAGSYVTAAMIGRNFADGRGNVVLHGEYAHQDILYAGGRADTRVASGFLTVDSDPSGTPNGSDGNPDRRFFRDIRGATISSAGLFSVRQPLTNPRCGLDSVGTAAYNCNFLLDETGRTLTPQTGFRTGTGQNGSFIGGNGPTNREENLVALYPNYDRYSVNLLAHFTVSDAFEPFIEAKYTKTKSFGRTSGPAFVQGGSIDADRERIRLDNPFLSPENRALLTAEILAAGINPNSTVDAPLSAAQMAAIADGSFRVQFRKNFTDLGVREETSDRQTYRIVAGLRGTFNDDWTYEISGNYGKFKENTLVGGNVDVQRLLLALDAGTDPATGQIRCRSQFDPDANFDVVGRSDEELAADVAACVPLNPFGRTDVSASRAYIVRDTVSHAELEQIVVNGFVSGDSSQMFELPAGPIGFALGAEYRREKVFYQADPLVEGGFTFYNALPTFNPGAFEVKEAFGELRFPILADVPFFQELTLSAAGRVADYKGATGTVYAYNGGVDWAPIRDLRLRANYSRAVRAPNLSETSFPLSQNFQSNPLFADPCGANNIGAGSATREANCRAQGVPVDYNPTNYSLEFQSGSNPNLGAEKSNSYTIGGVFQPSVVPGLSLSVDYYNITVKDVISAPSAQEVANICVDQPTLDNPFCDLFERYLGPAPGPNNEETGEILVGSLQAVPLNYAKLKVEGIDFELGYRHRFEDVGTLNFRGVYTRVIRTDEYLNPAEPDRRDPDLFEGGDPRDQFNLSLDLETGGVTFGYDFRYIGKQFTAVATYEDYFPVQGRPAQNTDFADPQYFPSTVYHDVRLSIDATDRFNFYMGVDNVANKRPPLGLTGTTDVGGLYDNRGRYFYAGAVAKF